ncbi:hypothetical protein HG536_0C03600 [Torulaspora globosa]|uniref:DNA repair and recombination protein RDH54 n=1 Tax=Torulaspora globosa TaxID=48254 RepID=A0A7G3ZFA6_9SACH|nr:uncharacterized protein HG536_0C03600 [Torulaspora globosa]QLL32192.1 hypothetical protein HG536_0C03600 [Torulaspora globosa]
MITVWITSEAGLSQMHLPKYENKPFKPPRRLSQVGSVRPNSSTAKVTVKRCVGNLAPAPLEAKGAKKLKCESQGLQDGRKIYTVVHRKPSLKKHKTWDGDGYAISKSLNTFSFYDNSGKFIANSVYADEQEQLFDHIFKAASLELQLDYEITDAEERREAEIVLGKPDNALKGQDVSEATSKRQAESIRQTLCVTAEKASVSNIKAEQKRAFSPMLRKSKGSEASSMKDAKLKPKRNYSPLFDVSKIENPVVMNKARDADIDVIVDPLISRHLRPHQREGVKFMYDCLLGLARPMEPSSATAMTDVTSKSLVLEPDADIQGCLLADEMGLGKTLMTIALIWTLLKQTPKVSQVPCSQHGVPLQGLCQKVLIVCPVTLIGNWRREFDKWLNLSRIGVLTLSANNTAERDKYDVRNFLRIQRTYQVLIIGYEKLLSVSEELRLGKDSLDLLVCDEGHRLKNGASKILNTLKSLDVGRKILLSGTPIQNDLNEYYTIIDFINPGILGNYSQFKKRFINPISRARDPANKFNEVAVQKGEERSSEMIQITQRFILRRTSSILTKYLPPRTDLILCCRPTEVQISAFRDILQGAQLDLTNLNFNSSLALITLLKKVCNSPTLIQNDSFYNSKLQEAKVLNKYNRALNSGKLKVLMALVERIRNGTDNEKVVVVSNYTQTLDIIENLMRSADMQICRLDGSTQAKQRDSIVCSFNNNPSIFAFLLSAKSGGVGLNLTAASRLVLFDNDWNPSVDLQAMSRIHRDGQKRHCYIYRLVTTGCIDEKILQRQLMKHSLSQKFLCDSTANEGHADDDLFSKEDLKDLFTISCETLSNTHDLICSCKGNSEISANDNTPTVKQAPIKRAATKLNHWQSALEARRLIEQSESENNNEKISLMKRCLVGYKHIDPNIVNDLMDPVATEAFQRVSNDISFVFVKPGEPTLEVT